MRFSKDVSLNSSGLEVEILDRLFPNRNATPLLLAPLLHNRTSMTAFPLLVKGYASSWSFILHQLGLSRSIHALWLERNVVASLFVPFARLL